MTYEQKSFKFVYKLWVEIFTVVTPKLLYTVFLLRSLQVYTEFSIVKGEGVRGSF